MHILAAQSRRIDDGGDAVDLDQSPGDIVILSAADTELSGFAHCAPVLGGGTSLRLASIMALSHPYSIDLYVEKTLSTSRCIILRLLGGADYWSYGLERVREAALANGLQLLVLPGDDKWDADLVSRSTVSPETAQLFWRYCIEGGEENQQNALLFAASLLDDSEPPALPKPLARAGLWWPDGPTPGLEELENRWRDPARPRAAITFYRAMVQGAATKPVAALVRALDEAGVNAVPIFVSSLKDPESVSILNDVLDRHRPDVVLNGTAFAVSKGGSVHKPTPLDSHGVSVLQVVFSSVSEQGWQESDRGLGIRDLAMHVVLPELDGRLLTRAVSFKEEGLFDIQTQSTPVRFVPKPDRIDFVAKLASAWATLGKKSKSKKRLAVILANYPNKDGRIANGVGLDTPASAVAVMQDLKHAGYDIQNAPETARDLMDMLLAGATNDLSKTSDTSRNPSFSVEDYEKRFKELPEKVRIEIQERWGNPGNDPHVRGGRFLLPLLMFGNVAVGIQPARGYNIDPKETYHDPSLVPPHNYFAFYFWLRHTYGIDAVVHLGKHGNLEWLPGKALALSETCYPEAVLGPVPNIYPFIVNDPGEGAQAKRRNSAVIVDHLTPPLARAESHGVAEELETLLDEYYLATGVDPRRMDLIENDILDLAARHGLDLDIGLKKDMDRATQLSRIDAHLCDLKEMQIRDGLHILGKSPTGDELTETVVALARVPRGAKPTDASLQRALAADLRLEAFDPLDCDMAAPWSGTRPEMLASISSDPWRSAGDTVERLELLALNIVASGDVQESWPHTRQVMAEVEQRLQPAIEHSGALELQAVRDALDGRFVAPGPSGAPTRGRPDVLPTGRNFYSVDVRAVPTEIAWRLGWQSAAGLVERYYMDEGEWPTSMALTAWGTSNMRTGGDDIAQALALIGAKPIWEKGSGRVTGYEIIPLAELSRPRIDVTLRISGFFRDAFPHQIDLFDSAVTAVAALDEPEDANPIAARVKQQTAELVASGVSKEQASRRATYRVFGSKPGAYGAGLQALIDEGIWSERQDFANAFLEWGSYAYGGGAEGQRDRELFEKRLSGVDAVVQNQDNREHDLLDSDDYYQFEGGLSASVETLRGDAPKVYHNDHSRPERPVIRTLEEEIGRVVRGRASNPKWIAGVMRHGYKGAFEIAATVDYLFAFSATTKAVRDHHFDQLHAAYLQNEDVRAFIAEHNPSALAEIAARFAEAIDRGLWAPRRNATYGELITLKASLEEERRHG
ncbi:MAG: cobaltochelatase subunit CobN [Stappiaceae bacterium]